VNPHKRLSDGLYERLHDMIITLELEPGRALNEKVLMERLATGRTPLREAFHRLAAEGLIEIVPRQGTFVASADVGDLRAIFEIRLQLEPYSAFLAAERATTEEKQEMHEILNRPTWNDPTYRHRLDLEFHHCLGQAARNPRMAIILEGLQVHSVRFFRLLNAVRQPLDEVHEEHQAVFEAIERRDGERAAAVMRKHVEGSRERLLAALSGQ
jgi:DNA-binding GntR family transcriptional regulator